MLLAVDAGNRTVTVGFREAGTWLAVRRFGSSAGRTADEYALLMSTALAGAGGDRGPPAVDSAFLSSVVPAMTPLLAQAVRTAFGIEATVIGPGVRTGVRIRTDVPSEVGSDLVCAAAAARELLGGPCVVVDFGAALSFSAVGAGGEFLGCAIAPGIPAAVESLRANAAQIPDVRLDIPPRAIGRTTAQSVQAGIILGYGGLVSRMVERFQAEMADEASLTGSTVEVIGTGDSQGKTILAACGFTRFVPDLVLEGIALVAERASPLTNPSTPR